MDRFLFIMCLILITLLVYVSPQVLTELKRIIDDSEIMQYVAIILDNTKWRL